MELAHPAGNGRLITSLIGNGRQDHKFGSEAVYFCINCAGADENTYRWKSRGDEKQLIDLEWPYKNKKYQDIMRNSSNSEFLTLTVVFCE